MGLTFHIDIPEEEGGEGQDLVAHGSEAAVTPCNVYIYVKLYAEYRMLRGSEQCLQVK